MEILVQAVPPARVRDAGAVLLLAKGEDVVRRAGAFGPELRRQARALAARRLFDGSAGQVQTLLSGRGGRVGALTLVGLGEARRVDADALRRAAATGLRAARDQGGAELTLEVPSGPGRAFEPERAAAALVEGGLLGLYRYEAHKTEKSRSQVTRLTLATGPRSRAAVRRGVARGRVLAEATNFVRDLGNEPGNVATPAWVAARAVALAEAEGLEATVLEKADMERLGMGSLLGVARGSAEPPKLVVLTYAPAGRRRVPTVALVGKGITFDTGGISIKPAAKLEDMKFDMCGGAAVLGALAAVARLKLPLRVVGLVPLAENMPDGNAYKPGDVLKASNGVTIEVKNTDAEGRLILADALAYASKHLRPRPRALIDVATLTGACGIALGDQFAALVGNDDRLAEHLLAASRASGEPLWRLPLVDGYRRQLDSVFADVSNLGTPGAGVQTGAAFLEKFVGGLPWAHLDVASMAWTERDAGPLRKGATGYGVRLLVEALSTWSRR